MSTVLISGASVAGPTLAYWLHRHGFDVTVVEKASALRGGGYAIDIRGTALDVVDRMGLLPDLRATHVGTRRITFLHPDGGVITSVRPDAVAGGVEGRDLEVRRGNLAELLYAAVRDDVEFLFDDTIVALDDHADGVDVTFRGGARRTFDLVIGADGLHSVVRSLVLGPEEQFHRYLGYCFAGFTMPNELGLSHEGVLWNTPGRAAVLYALGESENVHGFLSFALPEPPFHAFRDPAAQRDLVASVFADDGWEIPRMVAAMRDSDDLFFDVVSQIHLPRWSSGRVALVGDAAFAPSFLTGQGTSVALVGAYMLAGHLATAPDHTRAFAAYERSTRPFVELNQALVTEGNASMFPNTAEALAERNAALLKLTSLPADTGRPAHSALQLPTFTQH
ncbi:2-polyprenyl-6-methoxyphenol hydroxylase [Streptoalloteichus tenebrarius]|uniref:2-polyprenyl-6-methoxyphenol hydroxylase n=1 Tax=Streptoalloteichus tenebrarius (strain ATCC 17920 / DSM 40477 / JCM 4838 / CBS 697.72 / NBRC 16177 / NCIMB 11028 / NRRL B-12390 / A12253. 1 / ISP 5477) TaxID=1933 RepID=A0ABT1HNN1_STRSD|nr:FAD-dependent monooxygenase [Streptoalloteichus tenebrarius]MCP2257117.1 2-polyprenyl-6-methoxyphenol hydroxylase [Streptoalloteichus tenebrarius]BFE98749.1 FAD-dependent monooxygenase [Streptoalloteichus tenebrarius]